ncbi:uncharacterized protein LOC131690894 isoform X2 [Topomyia yanbarensis]|uniref:uncharacterized protein LOC131690894 isoform X2 n=1 Tax=Topomyia yanbarensis TaxID=2498891 RepID=UPI00273C9ECA|nr:uncharacterized protein LOC131690894 isoform X2 [Topomyia yanbarensis]
MYGNADGVKKWNEVFPKLVQYLDRPYKDDISRDAKHCSILLLLNKVLKPTKVTRNFKPSVLVAQEEVILFAASDESAAKVLEKFTDDYKKYGFQPVPKLVFIGKNVNSLGGEFQAQTSM